MIVAVFLERREIVLNGVEVWVIRRQNSRVAPVCSISGTVSGDLSKAALSLMTRC